MQSKTIVKELDTEKNVKVLLYMKSMNREKNFYNQEYSSGRYAKSQEILGESHVFYRFLVEYVKKNKLNEWHAKCLEVGSGRGIMQDVVTDYTGVDLSEKVSKYYHKRFLTASADKLPFEDDEFDLIWSFAVWEHVTDPEKAFEEVIRVAKSGGRFLFCPAWHCRRWAANGYRVRPYSDFDMPGKVYKFLIPFLDSKVVRGTGMLFDRVMSFIHYKVLRKKKLRYSRLNANYEHYWTSDSDACCTLDQYSVINWFQNHGCRWKGTNPFFTNIQCLEFIL